MINKYIDHTLLKASATKVEITKLCEEARDFDFAAVCINSYYVSLAKNELKGCDTKVCTVVGFPLGASPTSTKFHEAEEAINDGVDEIDMVINIGALKDKDYKYVQNDIQTLSNLCQKHQKVLKVIIETSLLTEEEKIQACKITNNTNADYIKTSTGFGGGGATEEDIILMSKNIGPNIKIKASGGVRDKETAKRMIELGASRIGTSSGLAICS